MLLRSAVPEGCRQAVTDRDLTLNNMMKVCERVVLCKLEKLIKDYIDPLQFACRKNGSTDDAVLYSLENIYSHLENKNKNGSTVRLMFFDFSSALKTIQPHLLVQKLKNETTVIRYFMDL